MSKFIKYLWATLQMFAQGAGTVVNASTTYVNAYTGAEDAFSGKNTMDGELKTFYDTELLENARIEMLYAQFGKTQPLPAGNGTTVEWRKWNTFDRADELQEGVIPDGQKFGMSKKTAAIKQYGTYATFSDKLQLHAYDPIIMGATEEMSASAAETQEALIRDGLLVGTNVMYCDNINLATGAKEGETPTQPSEMHAASVGGWAVLTPEMVNRAVTKLKKDKVPRINGKYVCVIHPSVAEDLRSSKAWIEAHKYAAPEQIFNGEIGELHGCRFIENTFAPVLGDSYNNADGGVTYPCYFFGKDAFGIIDPEGGALQMIAHDKGEIGGPLDQFSTVGYKLESNGCTILYPERVLRVMAVSKNYSAIDDPTNA